MTDYIGGEAARLSQAAELNRTAVAKPGGLLIEPQQDT
jgi:hypothetical protein